MSGGVLALGIFLGRNREAARDRNGARSAARELHDHFKEKFGSSCCRVQNMETGDNKKTHFLKCARMTAAVAGMAAELILKRRGELLDHVDRQYPEIEGSMVKTTFRRVAGLIR